MTNYPTKNEILKEIETIPPAPEAIAILKVFKDLEGRDFEAIQRLILALWRVYTPAKPPKVIQAHLYAYSPSQEVVMIGPKISIISSLHELGHALHGRSELSACAFSVGLFKAVFPTAYSKLRWQGHMLVKKS